jgi:hypothetical protein
VKATAVCLGLMLPLLAGCGAAPAAPQPPTVTASVKQVHSPAPPYSATMHLPQLVWAGHAAVAARVNAAVNAWASDQVAAFGGRVAQDLAGAHNLPASLPQSSMTITYAVTRIGPALVSFRFEVEPYLRGAAHPEQNPAGLTFDLRDGSAYTLAALFRPGYLPALARAAGDGLAGFHPAGARCYLGKGPAATADALAAWWLAPDGLVLAFPAGVYTADYCGPPTLTLPYSQLRPLAAPGSPL